MIFCEVEISQTIETIITMTSTTSVSTSTISNTTSTTTTSSTTETVIQEMFESTLKRKEVTSQTIAICRSLDSYHMKLEQWSLAIKVTRKSLSLVWKFIVSGAGTVAFAQHFATEGIDLAISLAICHRRSHHFHEAEEIYIRLFRACQSSCHVEDGRYVRCSEVLIKFYEEHRHCHKVIEIYEELLVQYRKTLEAAYNLTIRTLYIMGSLCAEHGQGITEEYYLEIIEVLNYGSKVCHVDALDAIFVIYRIHYEAGHWQKLKTVCTVLWETWIDQHHGHHKFTAEFVEILYQRYRYVLEHHLVCEYSFLRQLTIEYRKTCVRVFGTAASITIKASIELAQLSMRSELYIQEAVSIYEEVLITIKTSTTTSTTTTTTNKTLSVSTTTITKIKENLTKAYVSICIHGSISTTTIERAIIIINERFESLKITFGCAHKHTLTCLRELILLQMKLKKQPSQTLLLSTFVEIIKTGERSIVLHEAAKTLADIYISCALSEYGLSLVEDLRLQIVSGTKTEISKFNFDKAVSKVSYVFVVTFEQVIRGQTISYSEIMANLLTETFLYESYHTSVKTQTDNAVILVRAARL